MFESVPRVAMDAAPMFSGAVPNVLANTTRRRLPAIDVRTICRRVSLSGVTGGGLTGGAFGAGAGNTAGRATTAVVHVATQCSAVLDCPTSEDALSARTVNVRTDCRTMAMAVSFKLVTARDRVPA